MHRPLLILLTCCISPILHAQTAVSDPTFNPGDPGFGYGWGFYERAGLANGKGNCMIVQTDGKVVIGGNWDASDAWLVKKLVRLHTNGDIDFTFNTGSGFNGEVYSVLQQPGGKLLVGGAFTSYSGSPCNYLCRLNADGTFDASFVSVPGCDSKVRDIIAVPGNKYVIAGDFGAVNGASRGRIARIDPNGINDATFNLGGSGVSGIVRCLALQADGSILVGGAISGYNGTVRNNLLRISSTGSLDATYLSAAGAGPNGQVNDVEIQGTFHIVSGAYTSFSGFTRHAIARITSAGAMAAALPSIYGAPAYRDILVLADGTALVASDDVTTWGTRFASWNSGGTYSALADDMHDNFMHALRAVANTEVGWLFAQQADGRIIMLIEGKVGSIARFESDGTHDPSFVCGYGLSGQASLGRVDPAVECTAADQVLIGNTVRVGRDVSYLLTRRSPDCTADGLWQQNAAAKGDGCLSMASLPDGQVIFSDTYNTFRLYSSVGTYTGIGASYISHSVYGVQNGIAIYPDGRFIVGGSPESSAGFEMAERYLSTGGWDPSFSPPGGTDFTEGMNSVVIAGDERIYVGGDFVMLNSTVRNRIARLLANGSIDPAFDPLMGFDGPVNDMVEQPDGKLVVTGSFATYRGISVPGICRLNPDASLDATFSTGTGLNGPGYKLLLRIDGLIFVCGEFSAYNGALRGSLACINGDGSVNTAFDTGAGFRDNLGAPALACDMDLQSDGALVVVGRFTRYNGTGRNGIARIIVPGFTRVSARVLLDGPWNGTIMSDGLRVSGFIPLHEPYAAMGYPHMGGGSESTSAQVLALQGDNAIVDWVVVELRDPVDPSIVRRTRSALLQRNGYLVDVDGGTGVTFFGIQGLHYVAIRHRNHLGVMTSAPVLLDQQTAPIDFSLTTTATYGNDARRNNGGAMTFWSGDVKRDGVLKYTGSDNDRDVILQTIGSTTPNNSVTGYSGADVDLDGVVKYTGSDNDRDRILVNVGSITPNNTRVAQLP